MIDRTSKIILLLIAAGLWANVLVSQVRVANAQEDYSDVLGSIASDVSGIASGTCTNSKIC
jgi:hypothetical protein